MHWLSLSKAVHGMFKSTVLTLLLLEGCKVVLGVLGCGLHGHITRFPASRAHLETADLLAKCTIPQTGIFWTQF